MNKYFNIFAKMVLVWLVNLVDEWVQRNIQLWSGVAKLLDRLLLLIALQDKIQGKHTDP